MFHHELCIAHNTEYVNILFHTKIPKRMRINKRWSISHCEGMAPFDIHFYL